MINKLVRIIIEGEGKRERESLSNCCRWENSGRHGPGGGGGAWSRRRFPGAVVKVGRATRFPSGLMWRRNEASAWRRTRSAPCVVEGTQWRWTRRRSGRRQVCGGEMIGLGFRDSDILKKKNNSDMHDDIINKHCYI
jgi:hypothetical protein